MKLPLLPLNLLFLASSVSAAAATVDGSVPNPPIPAVRAEAPPVIDGALDDACWRAAPVVTGFMHDVRPASVETEVRMTYDGAALYFAFTCHDPQPDTIRAQQRKRNGGMDHEDVVSVGIDPLFDRQTAYWFTLNALGTQAEDIPGGSASKVEWRGDWHGAARRTSDGWTAEMAVPFSILRYPRGQRTFGLMFERQVPRLEEGGNWPIHTFYHVHDNEARWDGLETPRIQRRPRVMPYLLGASGTIQSNSGVDVKYTSEGGVTSLLTVRPDFATIEDVVDTIDFSYNPRQLEDRRPFFTEGGGYFGSRYGFYSRSIGQVDTGVKSFGKVGPWTFAGLGTTRQAEGSNGVGYLSYDPSPSVGFWGGAVTRQGEPLLDENGDRTGETLNNTVLRLGAKYWKPLKVNGIEFATEFNRSTTSGPGGDGHAFHAGVDRYGGDGVFEYHVGYDQVSPDYTARLAFLPEVAYRSWGGWMGNSKLVNRGGIRSWEAGLGFDYTDHWGGGMWHRGLFPSMDLNFSNDMHLGISMDVNDRDAFRDRVAGTHVRWHNSDLYNRGGASIRTGHVAGGPYTFADAFQGVRFTEKLSGNVTYSLLHLRGTLEHRNANRFILGGLYEISDERSVALRFIFGTEDEALRDTEAAAFTEDSRSLQNAYLAFRQELRKGADIFVLLGDPNTTGIHSQAAVKYVVTY